jgi:hypothetical protein
MHLICIIAIDDVQHNYSGVDKVDAVNTQLICISSLIHSFLHSAVGLAVKEANGEGQRVFAASAFIRSCIIIIIEEQ